MIKGGGRIVVNPLHDMRHILVPTERVDLPGFLQINKCGTTTMSQALRRKYVTESYSKERYPARPIVAMWREPFGRMESTFKMYTAKPEVHPSFTKIYGFEKVPSFGDWLDASLDRYEAGKQQDVHQLPMFEVASDRYGVFVPTIIVRWDWVRLAEIFELDPLPIKNPSLPRPTVWSPEQKNRYKALYAKDFEIWEG